MKSRTHQGFTLIELLVVISLIAVLIAILIPALGKARELARRAVCMGNMRQLQTAWYSYATDNDGYIVNAQPFPPDNTGSMSHLRKPWLANTPGDFTTTMEGILSKRIVDPEATCKALMQTGALAPYVGDVGAYLCPARYRSIKTEIYYWLCSYDIVASMNAFSPTQWKIFHQDQDPGSLMTVGQLRPVGQRSLEVWKLSQIVGTSPAKRLVFVDNGSDTQLAWYNLSMAPGLIRPLTGKYYSPFPPIPHANGTCMSFADGHVEYWKWKNTNTITQGKYHRRYIEGENPEPFKVSLWWCMNPDNEDGNRVRQAIWTIAWLK